MPTFYLYPLLVSHALLLAVAFVGVVLCRVFDAHPATVACLAVVAYSMVLVLFLQRFSRRVRQEKQAQAVACASYYGLGNTVLSAPATERWFRLINKPAASGVASLPH